MHIAASFQRRVLARRGVSVLGPHKQRQFRRKVRDDTMSRISAVSAADAPLRVKPFFANGGPGAVGASLAHVPELMEAAMPFLGAIYGESAISMRHREIVVLRVSARMRCRYCVETHTAIARNVGLTVAEVCSLREPGDLGNTFVDARERMLIRWSDALTAGSEPVSVTLFEELSAIFTSQKSSN